MGRPLHPKMIARGIAVKAAHAHLTKTVPGFKALPGPKRLTAVHAHIKANGMPKGGCY